MTAPFRAAIATSLAALIAASAAAEEVTLTAVHSLPANNDLMASYFAFVDDVNANGEGLLQIQVRGGREIIPQREQYNAVSRGIVDMYLGPAGYYEGQVPELAAMSGAAVPADKLREAGLHAAPDGAARERTGVAVLGRMGPGYSFQFYLKDEPKIDEEGILDLSGLKIRGGGSYAPMYDALGIARVAIPAGEVYTALERGVVDGVGFVTLGVSDAGWQDHLGYRIFPTWRQGNTIIAMNAEKYDTLSDEQRAYLDEMVAKHEMLAHEAASALEEKDTAILGGAGVEDVVLNEAGSAALLDAFYSTFWPTIEEKVGEGAAELQAIVETANGGS